jgi:rubrerythrin
MNTNPLKFALELEAMGAQLYLTLAAKTTNRLAKLLFYSLADKEVEHARRFDTIYADLHNKNSDVSLPKETEAGVEQELKAFFKKAGETDLKSGKVQIEGYESAMELERKSYDAYKKFGDEAKTEAEKKFFQALMAEENEHYVALSNVYLYLTDNGDWMQEDEGGRWNWMNT